MENDTIILVTYFSSPLSELFHLPSRQTFWIGKQSFISEVICLKRKQSEIYCFTFKKCFKTVGYCSFKQTLLTQKGMMHFWGDYFIGGLIQIWSIYNSSTVYVGLCVSMVKREMSCSATVWLIDVFFNSFWTTVEFCGTEEEGISGFDTNTIPFVLVWGFLCAFSWFFIFEKK